MTQQGQRIVVAAGMLTVLFLPVLALSDMRPDDPAETAAPGGADQPAVEWRRIGDSNP